MADEVLVADSGSTDGTLEIARELGCRIIEREYGTSGDFKNWAIPQAAHEWVFILDADERITPALAAEIRGELVEPTARWLLGLSPQSFHGPPDPVRPVEERPLPAACSGATWGDTSARPIMRRSSYRAARSAGCASGSRITRAIRIRSICRSCRATPTCKRALWQAEGRRAKLRHLLLRFPLRFLQGYVWRLGFLDGLAGLQVCVLVAYLSWLKQAYLWQLQSGRDWRERTEPREFRVPPGSASAASKRDSASSSRAALAEPVAHASERAMGSAASWGYASCVIG